ncbi:MAG: cytochrome C oxidase subunit I, partial [Myxococcota bacterium]
MAAARAWLFLALSALAGSVACAVLLVLMRAPGLATLLPARALFPSVLALHVDLAIVVWFLAMASAWFSVHTRPGRGDGAAATAGAIGAATMVAGGLASGGDAVMNNYLPVLRSPLFGIGLVTFFAAVAFAAIRAIADPSEAGAPWERLGARLAAGTTLVAFAAFAASLAGLPAGLDAHARYEALFWAGGHVLQFTHGGLLLTLWLVLAREGGVLRAPPRVVSALLVLGAAPVLAAAGGYGDPVGSIAHRAWFTGLMRWGTWPAA